MHYLNFKSERDSNASRRRSRTQNWKLWLCLSKIIKITLILIGIISFEIRLAWVKKHLERKSWGFLFAWFFWGMWSLPKILRHKYQGKMDPRDCLHEKINFDRGNKKLRRKGNLWMLATLASQIPILSFGVASAWIGIFWSHSVRSKNRPFLLSFLLPLSKLDIAMSA